MPATDQPTLLALAAVVADQGAQSAALEARLEALEPKPRPLSPQDMALLAALRRAYPPGNAFWAKTVWALTAKDEALAQAVADITRPGKSATAAIGHALRRLTDAPTGGAVVRKIGKDDQGVVALWEPDDLTT